MAKKPERVGDTEEFKKYIGEFIDDKLDKMQAVSDELEKRFPKGDGKGYRFETKWRP